MTAKCLDQNRRNVFNETPVEPRVVNGWNEVVSLPLGNLRSCFVQSAMWKCFGEV